MTVYTTVAIATNATDNTVTVASATNMISGMPIVFSGNVFGNIIADATYYIGAINYGYPTSNITLTSLPGVGLYAVSTANGSMTATFSSGGQQIIPTEAPGVSLNTAFTYINTNFDQVFAAGPVGSNIQIKNNTIYTLDTNGNLTLNPNGIGNVMANASVNPAQDRVWSLGAPNLRWQNIYVEYGEIANANIASITLPVGNFHLLGGNANNILSTDGEGNLSWITQLPFAGGNNTQIQYNNDGILDGSNTFTFNANTNTVTIANLATTGTANLNSVGNIHIAGGVPGYVLQTDGSGNLSWVSPTGNTSLILDQQIQGDSSNVSYELITSGVTNSILVAINGVQQLPGVAYTVLGNVITFAEPLLTSEIADIRFLVGGPAGNGQPGGANGFVQFNDGAGLGGSGNLTYNALTGNLYSANISVSGNITAAYYYGDGGLLGNIHATANTGNIIFSNNVISTDNPANIISISAPQQTPVGISTGGNLATSQLLWVTNITALNPADLNNAIISGNSWGSGITTGNTGVIVASNSVSGLKTWTFKTDGTLSSTGGIVAGNVNAGNISSTGTITANIDISAAGNVSGTYILGNVALANGLPEVYGNSNVANYLNGSIGNVIPLANISYSLGNATNQWLDLWVSNATIYMNSVPITLGAGNVLTVAGNNVVTTSGDATGLGNIAFDGNNIYNINGAGEGILISSNKGGGLDGEIYLPYKEETVNLTITNYGANIVLAIQGSHAWQFDTTGNLTLPGGGVIGDTYGDNANAAGLAAGPTGYAIINSYDRAQFIQVDDSNVYIGTSYGDSDWVWTFDPAGNLTLPSNTANINYANGVSILDGIGGSGSYGNAEVADYLPTYTGNLVNLGGDVNTSGNVSASGNVTAGGGAYFIGDGSLLTGITATANTSNITFNNSAIVGPSFGVVPSANSSVYIQPTVDSATQYQFSTGNLTAPGNVIISGVVKTTPLATSSLPSAAAVGAGARAFVNDANSNQFANLVVGGGIYNVPVFSNGTNWYIG
jgi:hypothetical protein